MKMEYINGGGCGSLIGYLEEQLDELYDVQCGFSGSLETYEARQAHIDCLSYILAHLRGEETNE